MIRHVSRAARHLLFWGLIAAALGMTGVRLALSGVEGYKARLASRVGVMVGAPVTIGRLGARMRGFSPEVVLSDIGIASIASAERNAIELREIRLGIHLLKAALKRDLLASSWVTLVGAKLTVKRNADGKLSIAGLREGEGDPLWLLETGKYEVLDSDIAWQDEQKQGRPLTFESVDMALINEGDRHRLNVLMRLPEKFGETLRVSVDFAGNLFDFKNLQGRAFLEGRNLNLPEWVTLDLPMAITVASGHGDLRIWSDWRQTQAVAVNAQADIRGLRLNRPGTEPFVAEQLQSRFYLGLSERQWQLNLKEFVLKTRERDEIKTWPDAVLSIKNAGGQEKAARRMALYAERLELQEAALLGRFLLPKENAAAKSLRDFNPKGELRDFALFADFDRQILSVNGGFNQAGFAAVGALPGLENLSGRIRGNRQQGAIELAGEDAVFHAPGLFREPLPLDRVAGTVQWRHTDEGLSIASPLLTLESRGIKTDSRLQFSVPDEGGEPFIDLQSRFSCSDVKVISRYLPAKSIASGVVDWLDHAFVKGSIPKGGFLLYGNPGDFPFTGSEGVFEVLFDAENVELAYQSGWPNLTGAAAEVLFYRQSLNVAVRQGAFYGVAVKQGDVVIRSLEAAGKLAIKGELEGDIGQALEFVRNSPLAERTNAFLRIAAPQGKAKFNLNLEIPLENGGGYRTDVEAQFKDAVLGLKSPALTLKNLTGNLKFDGKGVYGDSLTASFLDRPVKINLDTDGFKTEVRADGRAGIEALRIKLDMPWLDFARGEAAYRLALRLPHTEGKPTLTAQSDLNGVRLDLPDMLAKPANQQKPLSIAFEFDDRNTALVQLHYGNDFSAALKIGLNKPHVESGHILLGDGRAEPRSEPGLLLEIHRDRLQLRDWIRLTGTPSSGQKSKFDVAQIKVHGGQGLWGETGLGRFDLDLRRSDAYWEGSIDTAILKGRVKLPADLQGPERIELNLDRLDVFALTRFRLEDEGRGEARDYFPRLSVRSAKTFWNEADLGRFVLDTERVEDGLSFDRFELQGKDQRLALTGSWKSAGGRSQTRARGRLELVKGGSLFARLGINKDLTETSGVIDFDLNWQAPPYRFALADLEGAADVDFKSGRILSIEPGFGRVLGILAMAQWFKRLQLDFSDVYQEGLTFNSIKGRFNLAYGKAVTDDLVVDAVPAKISIVGETDFVNRTLDHVVTVTPKSADAVPIAGTIMGKFAALIDKTITGTEHEGFFFGSQYRVKGSWENAEILTLHEKEGLLQKTWSGITDFPSLLQK
ncbi:YhdP family protein [Methylomicrobium album]|uniref:TIGR02099 family protein n=1 Tax=Methylomicrobium album BG8 TaxID=686340 RepID=H8GKA1_METAL|nr:YhdP family protein [Methylomicrobium album]EIC29225.1 TIGR02099 family protein [Methylomicrobium album BG8]